MRRSRADLEATMRRRTILLADDDRPTRDAVRLRLESAGFLVVCADDGRSALEMAGRDRPDLVVLDIGMRADDDCSVHERLCLVPELSRIPVIGITEESPESVGCRALDRGARCVLYKPFRGIELVEACQAVLGFRWSADAG